MTLTTAHRGLRLGLSVWGRFQAAPKLSFDQVDAPHRLDHLVDPRAAHAGVHLDHARAAGLVRLPSSTCSTPRAEPERLNRLHAPDRRARPRPSCCDLAGRCKPVLLERRLSCRPVLGHAGEHASSPSLQDQVDVELHAIQVPLQEEIAASAEDRLLLGGNDAHGRACTRRAATRSCRPGRIPPRSRRTPA